MAGNGWLAVSDWTDWVGLWAALQVIGTILGVVLFALLVIGGVVYVAWGVISDERARRKRRLP